LALAKCRVLCGALSSIVAAARQGWEIDTKVTVHMEIREVTRRESGLSLADIRTEHQKKCCTSDTPLPRDLPRAISRSCLLCLASHTFFYLFLFNHTASKLYSYGTSAIFSTTFMAYTYALASIFYCTILLAVPFLSSRHGFRAQHPPAFLGLSYFHITLALFHVSFISRSLNLSSFRPCCPCLCFSSRDTNLLIM
jgi:hypothetical protein